MSTLLVKNALLLATFDDQRRELRDGGLFVRDGFIEQVGPSSELPSAADEVLDLSGHVVLPDLISVLDSGHLAHAYLDVFDQEPLPTDNPAWAHPGITLTPHIAALTEPRTSAGKVADNINIVRNGGKPNNLVDFAAGY